MSRTSQRRQRILDLIGTGDDDVDLLAVALGVSASTIRRDLAVMSEQGVITRTYGGAVLAPALPEQTLPARENLNRAGKAAIAAVAAARIADGDSVLLDSGSTTGALAQLLPGRRLRVTTSNLAVVPLLGNAPDTTLTVLAGTVRPISMGVVGPLAEMVLRRLSFDKVFLGADGVVAGRGLCEATAEQISLKELMAAQAAEVFVLADSSKLGRGTQNFWAPLQRRWTLITDSSATDAQLDPFIRLPLVTVVRA